MQERLKHIKTQALNPKSGLFYVSASFIVHFINYLFNFFMGRFLPAEFFGVVVFIGTVQLVTGVPASALASTVSRFTAYYHGKKSYHNIAKLWHQYEAIAWGAAIVTTIGFVLASPLLVSYFRLSNLWVAYLISSIIGISFIFSLQKGKLAGELEFFGLSIVVFTEAVTKLFIALFFIRLHAPLEVVLLAFPVSTLVAWLVSKVFEKAPQILILSNSGGKVSTKTFYFTSLVTSLTVTLLSSLDVLLAKHFLSPQEAGYYAVLSLLGKVIIFGNSTFVSFMTPYVSYAHGAGRSTVRMLRRIVIVSVVITLSIVFFYRIIPASLLNSLFSGKISPVYGQLFMYCVSMALLALGTGIVSYHLARAELTFVAMPVLAAIIFIIDVINHHSAISDLVQSSLLANLFFTLSVIVWDLLHVRLRFLLVNISELLQFVFEKRHPKYNENLSILILNWRDTKHMWAGGAEVYVHELAKRWVVKGHHVTQFCGNDSRNARNEVVDGVQIVRRGGFFMVYFWAAMYYIFKFRGRYNIIIDCENGLPFFSPLYARIPIICLVHHVHQTVFFHSLPFGVAHLAAFMEARIMPLVYRKTAFVAISASTKNALMQEGIISKDPRIIFPGISPNTYTPGTKSRYPVVTFVGRLQSYKRTDVLVNAFATIIKSRPDAKLYIAGMGQMRKELEELAKSLGISKSVLFLGKVTEMEKVRLLQKSWVFANPSFIEGWGITNIEANASGTPVVAADVPGLRDSVSHGVSGLLVPYGKPEAFAKAILRIIGETYLRERLENGAVSWARNFTWDGSADEFLDYINVVMTKYPQLPLRRSVTYEIAR